MRREGAVFEEWLIRAGGEDNFDDELIGEEFSAYTTNRLGVVGCGE